MLYTLLCRECRLVAIRRRGSVTPRAVASFEDRESRGDRRDGDEEVLLPS